MNYGNPYTTKLFPTRKSNESINSSQKVKILLQ